MRPMLHVRSVRSTVIKYSTAKSLNQLTVGRIKEKNQSSEVKLIENFLALVKSETVAENMYKYYVCMYF